MQRKLPLFILLGLAFVAVAYWIESVDYSISISYVNVWVKATDGKGQPITDLAPEDLTISEDGQAVPSECFEQIKYDLQPVDDDPFAEFRNADPPVRGPEQESPKKFALFLDLLNTTQGEIKNIEPTIQNFVTHLVHENNDVMLAALLPNRKMGILVPFTKNHQFIADTILKAPGNQIRDAQTSRNEDELINVIRDWEQGSRNFAGPLDFYRQLYGMIHVLAKEEKEQGLYTLSALRSFGDYLSTADLGDHTVIVYVSGGFTTDPGREYYAIVDESMKKYLADPKTQEADQLVESPEQDNDVINDLRNTAWYLNRLNVTLYSIDARGLVSGVQDISQQNSLRLTSGRDFFATHSQQESLSSLAQETGGVAFIGQQNYPSCFNKMVDDLNHQYLLCYRAPDHKKKGEYHTIKVVSKRPGIKLRYRRGYLG